MNILFAPTSSLAREIARHIESTPMRADTELDVDQLAQIIKGAKTVINCAAMVGVDRCYDRMPQAAAINAIWPVTLALACRQVGAQLIHFSTEAVFPCDVAGKVYSESDRPGPTTFYGTTKLDGECGAIIRLPLLYGPTHGKQIVAKLVRRLMRGEDVEVATDLFSTPVYTPDVVRHMSGPILPLVHITSDRLISLHDFIAEIAHRLNAVGRIRPALSARFPSKEPKPLHGGMRSNFVPPFSLDGGILKYAEWINENRTAFLSELLSPPPH